MNIIDMEKQLERLSNRFDVFEEKLDKFDDYMNKQINYQEFKDKQTKSFRQTLAVIGVLVSILVTFTGWGFFEKGLYTPVPGEQNFTVNANNQTPL